MSDIPGDLKFLPSHEWVRVEADGTVRVGVSQHAQEQLGDLVYVELPEQGAEVAAGSGVAVVESVKAASDIYAPVNGRIIAVNQALVDQPEIINQDAYGEGWIFQLKPAQPEQLQELLSADEYAELLDGEGSDHDQD